MTAVPIPPAPIAPVPPPRRKIRPKLGKNVLRVALVVSTVCLVLLAALAFLVAKSGLVTLPLFSYFYHGPVPVRVIQAKPLSWDGFVAQLTQRITRQHKAAQETVSFDISEEDLTGLLVGSVGGSLRDQGWKLVSAQIAVTPDHLEMFMKLTWRTYFKLDLLIRFKPVVDEDGDIHFEALGTRVGDFNLPASWGMNIGNYLFSRDLGSWEIKVGNQQSVKSLSLLEKSINVILLK